MLQSPRKTVLRSNSKTMAPEAGFASTHEKTDFVKFTKFLALKAVQIIIDSRKGTKIETKCKSQSSDLDWFNLSIQDSIEVTKATKKAFNDDVLSTFLANLCIEISLRTSDEDEMVLETWTLGLDQSQIDPTLKAMSTVYYRMGILLKSLVSVTRITPAYKLSRRQGTDSYRILYQLYTGSTMTDNLGEGPKQVRVGQLKTPLGAIFIMLSYRTNMIISPNKMQKMGSLVLKSDHFELSPKHIIYNKTRQKDKKEEKVIDLRKPLRAAAFVDTKIIEQMMINFYAKLPVPKRRRNSVPTSKAEEKDYLSTNSSQNTTEISKEDSTTAEKPPQKFCKLRNPTTELKLLQCPFADPNPIRELADFYRELFNAPYLNLSLKQELFEEPLLPEVKTNSDDEKELPKKLEDYANLADEFDDFLSGMHYSEESN